MKKKGLLITMAVMGAACIVLIGNAIIVSGFLVNPDKTMEQKSLVTTENLAYAKESVPALKLELDNPILTSDEYLSKVMKQEEIQMIYDFVDNSKSLAYDSTRDMTDAEVDRRMDLEDKYRYDELRPEYPLPLKAGGYDVHFDMVSETYHYPERELTDEELLQIIDWHARVNYALSLRNEQPKPNSKDITETEAIDLAIKSIRKLFDVDATTLEIRAGFKDNAPMQGSSWAITAAPYKMDTLRANGETVWNYIVFIDSLSGNIIDTTRACPTRERSKINETDLSSIMNDNSWLEAAASVVIDRQGEKRSITEIYVNVSDDFNSERGIVDVNVILEDGAAYLVSMYYPDKSLRCLSYSDGK